MKIQFVRFSCVFFRKARCCQHEVCHLLLVYCSGAWAIRQLIRDWREVSIIALKRKTFSNLEVTDGSWKREEGGYV
jgi:hypothetical protein